MSDRVTGHRRAHARRAARTPMETSVRIADAEAGVLISAVEELIERLETIADPKLERLRSRAESSLDRAKTAIAEGGAQVHRMTADLAEPDEGHIRPWALLGVAVVCVVALGLWSGRALLAE
jgi:ElaB/YqjD/DUF883 family membrane-anchored ribosome-binding protein